LSIVLLGLVAAAPAWAQEDEPIFTVAGTYTASQAELDHWTDVAALTTTTRRAARAQAFQVLLTWSWWFAEADLRGIVVTADEADKRIRAQIDEIFSTRREYRRWLRETGMTEADVLTRVRLDLITGRIRKAVLAPADASVTDARVHQYVAKHGNYTIPETRTVRMVVTRGRARAITAKRELLAGATWRSVGTRYSVDGAEGRPQALPREAFPPPVGGRVFHARLRRIVGPVRTQFGYFVFRVSRVHPEREMSTGRSRRIARALLLSRAREAAMERFLADFRTRWHAQTVCAPRYAKLPACVSESGSSSSAALMSSSHTAGLPSPAMRSISSSSRSDRHATASSSRDVDIISAWWSRTSRSRSP
jgi:foldase protein PrsA